MSDYQDIVTIDGPSGVGKSTISRIVAVRLGFTYLDTGAMYRGFASHLASCNIEPEDEQGLREALSSFELELIPAKGESDDVGVIVGGRDVSREIRLPEVSMAASAISALPPVREKLTAMQQEIGLAGQIVAEGRDTGTVVFPMARYKFYLDGDPEVRARRRLEQMRLKGELADEAEVLQKLMERDKNDSERAIAPLKQADDALYVDTTSLSIEEVCGLLLESIDEKRG